ncbi:MAG TPA: AraC family transcriptional regulator [Mucilaginibacter sp.]|jgi:AraC-like DNA-binding protein
MLNNLKPTYRQLAFHHDASLHVKIDSGENLRNSLHYHPEIELILLKRSAGMRVIGNSLETFKHKDVFLIGKNTPHSFHHQEDCLLNKDNAPEAIVVQFYDTFLGKEFLALPEFKEIQHLFTIAKQGVSLSEPGKIEVIPLIEKMPCATSLERILLLLNILRIMSNKGSYTLLTEEHDFFQLKEADDNRINKILNFTSENYDRNIKIEQIAVMVNLTKESFCRYFKSQTGKSYLEYLIEFRVCKACKILLKNQLSIKEVAYSCGFDSLSNFHYQFKKIIKQSPLEYKMFYSNQKQLENQRA